MHIGGLSSSLGHICEGLPVELRSVPGVLFQTVVSFGDKLPMVTWDCQVEPM